MLLLLRLLMCPGPLSIIWMKNLYYWQFYWSKYRANRSMWANAEKAYCFKYIIIIPITLTYKIQILRIKSVLNINMQRLEVITFWYPLCFMSHTLTLLCGIHLLCLPFFSSITYHSNSCSPSQSTKMYHWIFYPILRSFICNPCKMLGILQEFSYHPTLSSVTPPECSDTPYLLISNLILIFILELLSFLCNKIFREMRSFCHSLSSKWTRIRKFSCPGLIMNMISINSTF